MPLDSYEVQPMNWWRFSKHHANCKFSLASQMYVDSANLRWSLQLLNGLSRGHQLIHKSASANIDNKAVRSGLVEGEYKGRRKKKRERNGSLQNSYLSVFGFARKIKEREKKFSWKTVILCIWFSQRREGKLVEIKFHKFDFKQR